ncbi:acyltransferase [Facklamia sp. 7083-14-GEN3]|uniref:acyltransferase n=1 Tax=Facklamia sp. 7083-14-GEN3 TaxID=2973478 RepID=UPI00215CDA3D|nr:acyltransferase [Facklamia sp. 7083-14-GEN3]MCR8968942.1 acyltransferase [Facklamia sp. 7083-14-GEN3]
MSKRFISFDLLRGFATIAVLLIHLTAPQLPDSDLVTLFINQASRFAVPVFLILSGWGLDRTDALDSQIDYPAFLKERLLKILPAYFFWSIIYATTNFWLVGEELSFLTFIKLFLTGHLSYHLYFVPLIVGLYIFYPLLSKIAYNKYMAVAFAGIFIYQHISDHLIGYIPYDRLQDYYTYAFCFFFGIWLSRDFKVKLKRFEVYRYGILVFTLLTLGLLVEESYLSGGQVIGNTRPLVTFYSIGIVLTFMLYKLPGEKILLWFSRYSFLIYLSHVFFLKLLEVGVEGLSINLHPMVYLIMIGSGLVLILYLFIKLVDREPFKRLIS